MIFFSDAVIAIMLTLLALELPVPEVHDPLDLGEAFAAHGSVYIAFLISFCVIAATWTAHHMLFTHVSRADPALITLNLLCLLAYVLIPWASKTLGEVPNGAGVVVYSAAMAFLGGAMLLVVRHVTRSGLLDPAAPRQEIKGIQAWSGMTAVMFALSVPAGFIAGRWIMIAWPVGYLGLRLVAEYYLRKNRRPS
ncbi:TMEM175 family protein [Nonomuraea angiospora]